MSSSVDSEENNLKETYAEPNTLIISEPIIDHNLLSHSDDPIKLQEPIFEINALSILKYPQKEKLLKQMKWTVGTTFSTYIELTPSTYFANNPLAGTHVFWKFDNQFNIKIMTNSYNQGLGMVYFDPSPTIDYYTSVLGRTVTTADYFQFSNFLFTLMDTEAIKFKVPTVYPFNYFTQKIPYLNSYPLGRIKFIEIVPFKTNSPSTTVQINMSLALTDLQAKGNVLKSATILV